MEIFTETYSTDLFSLFMLYDIHMGNANCDVECLEKAVKHIRLTSAKRKTLVILGGDMCDVIVPQTGDKRFNPAEIDPEFTLRDLKDLPRKQYQKLAEYLKPIKDLIGYSLCGNHEESYIKRTGFDVYDYLCTDLLDCKKLGYHALGKIILNRSSGNDTKKILFMMGHGTGGGGFREGYPLNNLYDIGRKFLVDVYMVGHVHKLMVDSEEVLTIGNTNELQRRLKWYGVGGCFMRQHKIGTRGYFEGRKGTVSGIGFLEFKVDRTNTFWRTELVPHKFIEGRMT